MAYLLDQAIELAGPKTLSGKALIKSKQALHRGDDKTAGKYLYHAFDNLPKKHTDTPLTPKEKQLIEDQLAKLFQKNVTINCKVVDKLANKSYVHLQTGGSIVSYRYLLEALDLARLPIPKSLQKMAQVGSPKLQSTKLQSRCGQVGGSVPLIVGGVSLGLAILSAIILWIRHRNQPTSKLEGSSGVQSSVQHASMSPPSEESKSSKIPENLYATTSVAGDIPHPPGNLSNYQSLIKSSPQYVAASSYSTTPKTRTGVQSSVQYASAETPGQYQKLKKSPDFTFLYTPIDLPSVPVRHSAQKFVSTYAKNP